MALHRLYHACLAHDAPEPGDLIEIAGDEARHAASVKRLGAGAAVEVFDGLGVVAPGVIDSLGRRALRIRVAARFIPLITQRRVVEPRETRVAKWRQATAVESAKQCGRAWLIEIDDPTPLADVLRAQRDSVLLVGDSRGDSAHQALHDAGAAPSVALLIGPEGGFTDPERDAIRAAGAAPIALGPHVLRVETAAAVGAAVVIAALPRLS